MLQQHKAIVFSMGKGNPRSTKVPGMPTSLAHLQAVNNLLPFPSSPSTPPSMPHRGCSLQGWHSCCFREPRWAQAPTQTATP